MKNTSQIRLWIIVVMIISLVWQGPQQGSEAHAFSGRRQTARTQEKVLSGLSGSSWDSIQSQIETARYHFAWQAIQGVWAYRAPNPSLGLNLAASQNAIRIASQSSPDDSFVFTPISWGGQDLTPLTLTDNQEIIHRSLNCGQEKLINQSGSMDYEITLTTPPTGGAGTLVYDINGTMIPMVKNNQLLLSNSRGEVLYRMSIVSAADSTGASIPVKMTLEGASLTLTINQERPLRMPLTIRLSLFTQTIQLVSPAPNEHDHFGHDVSISGDVAAVSAPNAATGQVGTVYLFQRTEGGGDSWGYLGQVSDDAVGDQFGYAVALQGNILVVGAPFHDAGGDDRGAVYVYYRDKDGSNQWGLVKKLTTSDMEDDDRLGISVHIFGDLIVAGAPWEKILGNNAGAVYIFHRNAGGADAWGEVQKITAPDGQALSYFGSSVTVDGDVLVVGCPNDSGGGSLAGAAYVFHRNEGGARNWGFVKKLIGSDTEALEYFGSDVDLSGDILVVGADHEHRLGLFTGAAYVFYRHEGGVDNWGEVKRLTASNAAAGDYFGNSVAVDGDQIVIGSESDDSAVVNGGAAYVYRRNFGGLENWGQERILLPSNPEVADAFGFSVAIAGDVILAGTPYKDYVDAMTGSAYVFQESAYSWQESFPLTSNDIEVGDYFGFDLAIYGDTLVVGAVYEDQMGNSAGAAYVFQRNQNGPAQWGQVKKLVAQEPSPDDYFGASVAISGDVIVIGAWTEDTGANNAGAAYVFHQNEGGPNNWGEVKRLVASNAAAGDGFGVDVAVSGDVILVGAFDKDLGVSDAGSAYIFHRDEGGVDQWGEVKILTPSSPSENGFFGRHVDLCGDIAVVPAYGEVINTDRVGAVYLFERDKNGPDAWGETAKLLASDGKDEDQFGASVAVSGDIVAVGANFESTADTKAGAVYLFYRDHGGPENWGEFKKLTASDAAGYDNFGLTMDLSGDTLVVGATIAETTGVFAGAVYTFHRNMGGVDQWGELQKLTASDPSPGDYFGNPVAIWGDTLAAGAYRRNNSRGAVYILEAPLGVMYLPLVTK